jgi:acetyl esterase/lipase
MVWFFGGGMLQGNRSSVQCTPDGPPPCDDGLALRTALPLSVSELRASGVAVAAVDYRLCMGVHETLYPGQLEDAREAVAWLRTNGARFGVDGERVGCYGRSAGGGLCAALVVTRSGVRAGVTISGWADWFIQDESPRLNREQCGAVPVCAALGGKFLQAWTGAGNASKGLAHLPPAAQESLRRASLVGEVERWPPGTTAPPLMLLHHDGDYCHPVEQAVALEAALAQRGSPATLVTVPGRVHRPCFPRHVLRQALKFVLHEL